MDLCDLIKPLSLNEFISKINASESFLMPGDGERNFDELLTLAEIETSLNNGCNINSPAQIIINGLRYSIVDQDVHWSPAALKKKEMTNYLESGKSFMMMNMSQINSSVAKLIDTIEGTLNGCYADLHLYISPVNDGTGYDAHRDRPQHKIYLQVIGNTSWQIFSNSDDVSDDMIAISEEDENKYLTEIMNFTMNPGDVLYMPPGQFHKVRNHDGPRVSFSIPFVIDLESKKPRMDRSHIPFRSLFEESQRKLFK